MDGAQPDSAKLPHCPRRLPQLRCAAIMRPRAGHGREVEFRVYQECPFGDLRRSNAAPPLWSRALSSLANKVGSVEPTERRTRPPPDPNHRRAALVISLRPAFLGAVGEPVRVLTSK